MIATIEFQEVLKILAEGIKDKPAFAILGFIAVLATVVIGFFATPQRFKGLVVVLCFFTALVVAAIITFRIELNAQKRDVNDLPELVLSDTADTYHIVDRLNDDAKEDIRRALREAAADTAGVLGITNLTLVRANVFGLDRDGRLHMIKGLTVNFDPAHDPTDELGIIIQPGYGSTGRCYKKNAANIAIFREGWGENRLNEAELRKANTNLQWIISIPVRGQGSGGSPIWVMNVDGLKLARSEAQLREAMARLWRWSAIISRIIATTEKEVAVVSNVRVQATTIDYPIAFNILKSSSSFTNVYAADIAPNDSSFLEATRRFKTFKPLNIFTKAAFSNQVFKIFATEAKIEPPLAAPAFP